MPFFVVNSIHRLIITITIIVTINIKKDNNSNYDKENNKSNNTDNNNNNNTPFKSINN